MTDNVYEIPIDIIEAIPKSLNSKGGLIPKGFEKKISTESNIWLNETSPYPLRVLKLILERQNNNPSFTIICCKGCGKPLTNRQIISGSNYCSHKCSNNTEEFREKRKNTNLERYGVTDPCKNSEINKKRVETNLKKYGTTDPCKNSEVNSKREETNLERYGTRHLMQNDELLKRNRETMKTRYGAENITQSDYLKQKNLEKYGVEYQIASKEFREKSKVTYLERYGVENPQQCEEIKEKTTISFKENFYDTFVKNIENKNLKPLFSKNEYATTKGYLRYKCLKCGKIFSSYERKCNRISCDCSTRYGASEKENELFEFIRSLLPKETTIIRNDRKVLNGRELDIYIPDLHLAFEFNGNFWHSSAVADKDFHQKKTLDCLEKSIRLIHIYEWEWEYEREKIEHIISSSIGKFGRTVDANLCDVKEIQEDDYIEFLSNNNIRLLTKSDKRIGLYYNGELMCVVGYSVNGEDATINRLSVKHGVCLKDHLNIIINNINCNVITLCINPSHSDINLYLDEGFYIESYVEPSYVYVRKIEYLYVNDTFDAKAFLTEKCYDDTLTEEQNMANNGWFRLYDCGNLKLRFAKN